MVIVRRIFGDTCMLINIIILSIYKSFILSMSPIYLLSFLLRMHSESCFLNVVYVTWVLDLSSAIIRILLKSKHLKIKIVSMTFVMFQVALVEWA